jgi:hypothetical protein
MPTFAELEPILIVEARNLTEKPGKMMEKRTHALLSKKPEKMVPRRAKHLCML